MPHHDFQLPMDFKTLSYKRTPDRLFDVSDKNLLGQMYNDKMDKGQHDLGHCNIWGWSNFAWTFYKMSPGTWLPPHVDHFANYIEYYGVADRTKIKRALVYLEDWKPGHVAATDNNIEMGWKANNFSVRNHDTIHWGGNFGTEDRYTLLLTGCTNDTD